MKTPFFTLIRSFFSYVSSEKEREKALVRSSELKAVQEELARLRTHVNMELLEIHKILDEHLVRLTKGLKVQQVRQEQQAPKRRLLGGKS